MDEQSDDALVARARQGDRQAFEALLDRHLPLLARLCRRMLGDALLAEDAAQEAALLAFLHLERLRNAAQFGFWLNGIGLNICRQMLRRRARDAWSWEALVGGSAVREPIDPRSDPAEAAERRDLQQRIRYAVAALPPGQRAAVMLFYLAGLSYAETAAQLGIGAGTVRTRLHKARAALSQALQTIWREDDMNGSGTTEMVEMRVRDVWQSPAEGERPRQVLVILEEAGGERRFAIWVGQMEGEALAVALEQVEVPRPMTYTLTASLIEASGSRIEDVRIARLADNTFFAEIVLVGPAGRQVIDARPSDALNLAVRLGTPIHAAATVIEHATSVSWEETRRTMEQRGIPPEQMPSQEQFEWIAQVVRGETTGGAAAIVTELHLPG